MSLATVSLPRAFFSKSAAVRAGYVAAIRAAARGKVIHLRPKNAADPGIEGVSSYTYEDLEDHWLAINDGATNATLVLENASRYPRVAGTKFKRMQSLAKRVRDVAVVDVVPFTLEPRFLYTTFSYLGTDVLGISKYAALHEEYEELQEDGRVVRVGSDPVELARRIAPVSAIDYDQFRVDRKTVEVRCNFGEFERYGEMRDELFASELEPAPIVTKLADLTHAFPSRGEALLGLLRDVDEPAVVYVNLTSYANRINRAARAAGLSRHRAVSYQMGCQDETQVAVYMEAPIVNSHFLLDAESRIVEGGRAYEVRSDAKVDLYLWGRIDAELASIDALAGELSRCAR